MKKALLYTFVFILIQLILGFAVAMLAAVIWGKEASINPTTTLVVSGLSNVFAIILFYFLKWCPMSRDYIRTRPWTFLAWTAVLAFGLVTPLTWLEEFIPEAWRTDLIGDEMGKMINSTEGYFVICMLAPLAEEIVFRGAMIRALRTWLADRKGSEVQHTWIAIFISAFLFACIHMNPAQIPHAMIMGVILGWLFVKSGSIVPGVIVHWINNSMAYVFVKMFPTLPMDAPLKDYFGGSESAVLQAVAYSMLLVVPAFYQLRRLSRK